MSNRKEIFRRKYPLQIQEVDLKKPGATSYYILWGGACFVSSSTTYASKRYSSRDFAKCNGRGSTVDWLY